MKAAKGAARPMAHMPLGTGSDMFEGRVSAVGQGTVQASIDGDRNIEARCPAHIDRAWLAAAVAVAPVEAVFFVPRNGTRPILAGVFPGPEHAEVRADVTVRARRVRIEAEEFRVQGKNAHVAVDKQGAVEVRGRDVTTRATRINRVQGGAIRLN